MPRLLLISSLILLVALGGLNNSTAQVASIDLLAIKQEISLTESTKTNSKGHVHFYQAINPLFWLYKGSLKTYQKVLSPQIASSCIYETSCSRFSNLLVNEYGLAKGFFLSLDRITRCNRAYYAESSPLRKNEDGKIIESVNDLTRKNE